MSYAYNISYSPFGCILSPRIWIWYSAARISLFGWSRHSGVAFEPNISRPAITLARPNPQFRAEPLRFPMYSLASRNPSLAGVNRSRSSTAASLLSTAARSESQAASFSAKLRPRATSWMGNRGWAPRPRSCRRRSSARCWRTRGRRPAARHMEATSGSHTGVEVHGGIGGAGADLARMRWRCRQSAPARATQEAYIRGEGCAGAPAYLYARLRL